MSFRISVPSYVIPGTYKENLDFLHKNSSCRAVELLFFFYDEDAKALLKRELAEIRAYSTSFLFTVHMPDEVLLEHEELILATTDFTEHYIIHPPRNKNAMAEFASVMDKWRESHGTERFLLENTRLYNFNLAEKAMASSVFGPMPLCADIGHLLMEGCCPAEWVAERADRIKEIHVHGFDGAKDHVLFTGNEAWLRDLAPFVRNFNGVIEIELFSWAEQLAAQSMLAKAWSLAHASTRKRR